MQSYPIHKMYLHTRTFECRFIGYKICHFKCLPIQVGYKLKLNMIFVSAARPTL